MMYEGCGAGHVLSYRHLVGMQSVFIISNAPSCLLCYHLAMQTYHLSENSFQ